MSNFVASKVEGVQKIVSSWEHRVIKIEDWS